MKHALSLLAFIGLAIVSHRSAYSQAYLGTAGIAVTGAGDVSTKPDIVEVNLRVIGNAELTDDAIVKQHDARERVQKAFDGLKIANLTVEEINLGVRSGNAKDAAQMIMRGMPTNSNTPAQVEVASTLRVRVGKITDMQPADLMKMIGKLLDTAKDSGANVGSTDEEMAMAYRYGRVMANSIVRFVISDADRLREEAYKKAAADAKSRAERIARMHGVKLGGVLGVQETQNSGDEIIPRQQPADGFTDPNTPKLNEITAETMSGGTYRVRLSVRFAIESADKTATAQTTAPTAKSTE